MIELLSNTGFIMYSKKAAKLFGVNGAILLGELCAKYQYWLDNGGLLENEGWFFCTREDIGSDTMLSPFQQREAMRVLTENAVLETKLMGMPSRTYYRINADVLYTMMSRNLTPRHQETLHHDIKKLDTTKKETKKETKNVLPPIPRRLTCSIGSGMHIRKRLRSLWRKRHFKNSIHPKSCGNGSYLTLKRGKLQETGQKTEGNTYRTRPRISIKGDGRTKSRQ